MSVGCDSSCGMCNGPGPAKCTTCASTAFLRGERCESSCLSGQYSVDHICYGTGTKTTTMSRLPPDMCGVQRFQFVWMYRVQIRPFPLEWRVSFLLCPRDVCGGRQMFAMRSALRDLLVPRFVSQLSLAVLPEWDQFLCLRAQVPRPHLPRPRDENLRGLRL